MIYHLFESLKEYDIPGQGLFTYLSFRAMLASVTAMLLAFFAGRHIIRWLKRKQIGETIRDLGLQGQMEKKGTPTMGGIIIILSVVVPVLLFCDLTNIYTQLLLFTTLWCGAIGFLRMTTSRCSNTTRKAPSEGETGRTGRAGLSGRPGCLLQQRHCGPGKVPVSAEEPHVVAQGNMDSQRRL